MMKIISYTPQVSPIKFDIMVGSRWRGSVSLDLSVGVEYGYEELKSFVRLKRPSLAGGGNFDLLPCEKPVFRD